MWIEILYNIYEMKVSMVTPYAGVWIEMGKILESITIQSVTPYAGVWIEIRIITTVNKGTKSLPTRECGLKCDG